MPSLGNFAVDLIGALGGKPTPAAQKLFSSWQRWEGGHTANTATWNPLNLTAPGSGLPTINSVGVVALPSERAGVQRTANLIRSGYPALAAAFRTGQVNFANPAVQSDLNRWLTGNRVPGMTPYVSKIAAAYGGPQPSTPSAPAAVTSIPAVPGTPARTIPGTPGSRLPPVSVLNEGPLSQRVLQNFVSGGGRVNINALPGMTTNAWTSAPLPGVKAIPGTTILGKPAQPAEPGKLPPQVGSESRGGIAKTALTQIGIPYQWGGPAKLGARTDCSGLLQASARANGVSIGRTTYEQWKQGTPVPLGQLQPGDAVFFHPGPNGPEHVAIYIGNNKIVEDPHTGASVHISALAGRGAMGARRY